LYLHLLDFIPELLLCVALVLLLVLRLLKLFDKVHLGGIALTFTFFALAFSVAQWLAGEPGQVGDYLRLYGVRAPDSAVRMLFGDAKSGLLIYDHLTVFLRCFLYGFMALVIWLSMTTGIPDREDSGDFYVLLMGSTIGMVLMAMSMHLLMVFIAIEMTSLPSYALAGFLKGKRQSSEAALKYVVYGGGAAGIMLYGISLLAGKFGTAYLPDLAA